MMSCNTVEHERELLINQERPNIEAFVIHFRPAQSSMEKFKLFGLLRHPQSTFESDK